MGMHPDLGGCSPFHFTYRQEPGAGQGQYSGGGCRYQWQMEEGSAPRAAAPPRKAALSLLALLLAAASLAAQAGPYQPMGRRLEILKSWEKRPGRVPPELVAGIYERDYEGCDFENRVAITIDDCLPNMYLAMELDVLKQRGVKAVFFIIGSYFMSPWGQPMPRAKELLDRIVNEGHLIGSHGYWHRRLDQGEFRDDRAAIERELDMNEAAIDRILGYHYPILYFRPPNGAHSTPGYALDRMLRERGQYLANWTITSFDWCIRKKAGDPERLTPEKVIARTVKQAREESGGVVLVHGFPETARILGDLLAALAKARNGRGALSFSTLDELMRLKYSKAEPAKP
jgi:peptidoglycan/xylan/chitin deacetylase (PgdA/CDA1 family)